MYDTYVQYGRAILQIMSALTLKHFDQAVDILYNNMSQEQLDKCTQLLDILEDGFKTKQNTDVWEFVQHDIQKCYEQDMIYYTICYDGYRL